MLHSAMGICYYKYSDKNSYSQKNDGVMWCVFGAVWAIGSG